MGGGLSAAVWFPLHGKGCEADFVCTPAPIHNPDGSESLWCYTRPVELYGMLRDCLGHFPLMNYWGPLAGIQSTAWIADSAVIAARQCHPDFFYIYLPQLDYAAQRTGPDSAAADAARDELDEVLGRLAAGMAEAYDEELLWIVAGEYAITPVDHVSYPNRVLREAGLLALRETEDGEHLDFEQSRAFALVDHQFSHVFVAGGDEQLAERVAELFRGQPGIAEALVGTQRGRYDLEHPRSGEVILISTPQSWQAYYWWLSDDRAPPFAGTVDIHRKPGYDPMELCFDPVARQSPARCRAHQRLARRPGHRWLAAERAFGIRATDVSRPRPGRYRRVRHRAATFRPARAGPSRVRSHLCSTAAPAVQSRVIAGGGCATFPSRARAA